METSDPTHRPRKRFGQHFLHDQRVIERLIKVIHPRVGERLVEIGPGLGALTYPLLTSVGELDAVELDRDVVQHLAKYCATAGKLTIHQGDVLRFDLATLNPEPQSLRVVGNLPYNISTPLMFHMLEQSQWVQDMHFMVQKEVAQRLVAEPNSEHYGRLSVMIQYRCEVHLLFIVGPDSFTPPPKVDSAVVRLIPMRQPTYPAADEKTFSAIVNQAFSARRKTLRNALRTQLSAADIEALGIDPGTRSETLSVEEFVRLSDLAFQLNQTPN